MRVTTRTTSRIAAYVASTALVVSGSALAVSPADAATPDPVGVNQGAAWLQGELTGNVVHNDQFDFDDISLTADFAFALDAVGGHAGAVDNMVDAIEPRAHDEWYTSTFNGVTTTYGGSLAKLLVLAQETGRSATSFGGNNLVTLLQAQTADAAPIAGRVENTNDSFGDANVVGQAYAARGLATAGSPEAAAATSFLLKQQCSSGYFRLNFTASKSAAGQSCTDGTDTPDTDATAIAVLQLASQSSNGAVATAIAKAKTWLLNQQRCDGSFGGGTSTEGSNANSTGLTAWALGDTVSSRQAAAWLRAHQATSADSGNSLAGETGAIAYDDAGLAAGRTGGITAALQDQYRRATSQAVPGIRWYSSDAAPAIDLTGPAGYLKAGSRQVLRTAGAAAGTVLCVTGPGASTRGIATANGLTSTVTLPAGTGTRAYRVTDAFGQADTQNLRVLGKKSLSVTKSKARVKRGRYVTATVSGLAPAEWARVYYKGKPVRSGFASAAGRFTATFKVGRPKGKKTIVGYGQFTDIRRGSTTVKVVR